MSERGKPIVKKYFFVVFLVLIIDSSTYFTDAYSKGNKHLSLCVCVWGGGGPIFFFFFFFFFFLGGGGAGSKCLFL